MEKNVIEEKDVIDVEAYIKIRKQNKEKVKSIKEKRRVMVGPHATFYFENFETMLYQVQEMIYIERGGREQLLDELEAYNPMIPKGKNLSATLMFEIDNQKKRKEFLNSIGGIEHKIFIEINNKEKVFAIPEGDTERTDDSGKASSVHFIHFNFTDDQIKEFLNATSKITIGFEHTEYNHLTLLSEQNRNSLADDFQT
ncbi:MAG: hypothetical protein CMM91_03065 [Rickettsiales bacterium]|nr:hypothetical protein [Rickettsiales bacterium]OUV54041.1 MAG: hypothetical protein CBC87_01810 [Rickettsiales bacterium TMED127]|tara:strand:- start:39679 stop:40272 length:594 start_codon:yes stop_codon:yes gene_type:complete